jgi:hypothetical protein
MTKSFYSFRILLVTLSLGIVGCGTTGATNMSDHTAHSERERNLALAEQPQVEEVSMTVATTETSSPAAAPLILASGPAPRESVSAPEAPVHPSRPSTNDSKTPPPSTPKEPEASPAPSAPSSPSAPAGNESSANTFSGHIISIDQNKKFVIVDFHRGTVPPVGSELGVYRNDQFVGSVRITHPVKPPLTSADVLTGTLRRGDVVR